MSRWVLHDYLQVNGGAERLVIGLAAGLPGFSLGVSGIYGEFTGSGDLRGLTPFVPRLPSMLPRIPRALAAFGTNAFPIAESACVIYSGLYAPLAVGRQKTGRKIHYCHTPPRFAFGEKERYLSRVAPYLRPALSAAIDAYAARYRAALGRMDVVLANSAFTRDRLAGLGIASDIVYPPVDLDIFRWLGQEDYYLSVGRLEPHKRIDVIVRAFLAMPDKKLVVAGGGSQLEPLRQLAAHAPNITFLGWQDESAMARLVGRSTAIVYISQSEDFGMSAVEAMAAGKPVIAVSEGGLRESVSDGQTGLLLAPSPSPEELAAAVRHLDMRRAAAMRADCESRARDFSREAFLSAFSRLIPA